MSRNDLVRRLRAKLMDLKSQRRRVLVHVNNTPLVLEVASTPDELRLGLSGRCDVPDGRGMVFLFPAADRWGFWMKDTHIPLSVAFVRSDGTIAWIRDMAPESLETVKSPEAVKVAVEVPQGWFERNGVDEGDRFVVAGDLS